jgi:hypothetical protein
MNAVVCLRLNEKEAGKNERHKKAAAFVEVCMCSLRYLSLCWVWVCVSVYHNNAIISQQIQGKTHTLYHFSIGRFTPVSWVDKFLLFLYMDGAHTKSRDGWMVGCLVGKGSIEHIEELSAVLLYWVFASLNHMRAVGKTRRSLWRREKKSPAQKCHNCAALHGEFMAFASSLRSLASRRWWHYYLLVSSALAGRSASGHSSRLRGSLPLSLTSTHHTERGPGFYVSSDSSQSCLIMQKGKT